MEPKRMWDEQKRYFFYRRDLIPYITRCVDIEREVERGKYAPAEYIYGVSAIHKYTRDKHTLVTGLLTKKNAEKWIVDNFS
jgi:hypothetical protein